MGRPSKDYEAFSARLLKEDVEKINEINKETGLPKTVIVEKAVEMFYEYYKKTGKVKFDEKSI